jgi:MoaA/NifB/PqqE/SkfB family radical SAM enzyme
LVSAGKKHFAEVDKKSYKNSWSAFSSTPTSKARRGARRRDKKYDCNIPWAILMDPPSGCNLACTGCWAAQYGKKHNLSLETLDSICRQGKSLGSYFFILSGGEPLVRKDDIIRLCETHQDAYFFAFTNGTLVDEALCRDLLRVGNMAVAFWIEGDEKRRHEGGKALYRKVLAAMDLMREHRLLFGYSTCYHRYNTESVGSDEFVDEMIARGMPIRVEIIPISPWEKTPM